MRVLAVRNLLDIAAIRDFVFIFRFGFLCVRDVYRSVTFQNSSSEGRIPLYAFGAAAGAAFAFPVVPLRANSTRLALDFLRSFLLPLNSEEIAFLATF